MNFKSFIFLMALSLLITFAYGQQPVYKVAYADVAYIMERLPDMKELQAKVESTQTKLQDEFNVKQDQFKKELDAYTAAQNTMHDSIRVKTENHLRSLDGELQQFQGKAEETINNTRRLYMAPIYLKVSAALRSVAEEKGYAMILSKTVSNLFFVVYADKTVDVSDLVLQKLGVSPSDPAKQ